VQRVIAAKLARLIEIVVTLASGGRKLYYVPFSLLAVGLETSGYTFIWIFCIFGEVCVACDGVGTVINQNESNRLISHLVGAAVNFH
jgi:hypothetical protein